MAITTNVPSDQFEDLQRDVQDATRFSNATAQYQNRVGRTITPIPVRDDQYAAKIASLGFTRLEGVTFETGATVPDGRSLLLWATADGGTGFYYYFSGEIPSGGKIVPPDSTPASTGGTGTGGWLVIDDLESRLASGTADVGGETSGDLAKTINKSDIRLYGVPSLDVADLIQAALNATDRAYVPEGQWQHKGGTVLIDIYQHIFFAGTQITNTSTTYASFIKAVNKRDWSVTGSATYIGTRLSALDVGAEKFIEVEGGFDYVLSGALTARLCRSHGFHFKDGANSGGTRGQRARISDIAAIACDTGIETAPASNAEYLTFTNASAWNNRIGIKDGAGNTNFSGGNCCDNTETGFWLVGEYGNSAHGITSGMNINHNAIYNVRCVDVPNGHTFANCHIYGDGGSTGIIALSNCKGIVFDGGNIDCWVYDLGGAESGCNYIRNMFMPGGYGDVELYDAPGTGGGRPKNLIVTDCFGPGAYIDGVSINQPGLCYVHAFRGVSSQQALTSGTLTNLVFDSVESNGDIQGAYNSTTGIFTVPEGQSGQYRFTAVTVFSGTSLNSGSSAVEMVFPSRKTIIGMTASASNALLSGSATVDVYLTEGQTANVKGVIVGTSPVFGSASYSPSLTITRVS